MLLILSIVTFAGLVHGTLGLGFPMVATPLLALLLDVQSAILITLLPTVAVNIGSILYGGRWRASIGRYWPLALFAVVGSVLGTRFLIVSDPAPFRLLLAAMILLYLNIERIGQIPMGWIARYPLIGMMLFGLGAGFLAGTVNVMVPLLVIYALELGLATTVVVQVFNLCFLSGKLAQITVFSLSGAFGFETAIDSLPVVGAALLALAVGILLRRRIEAAFYRRLLKRLLVVVVLLLVAQYFLQ